MIAKDLMSSPVVTIQENSTVLDAAQLMLKKDVSALPVLDASERLVGILTHSDFGLSPKYRPLVDNIYSLLGASSTPQHLEETAHRVGSKRVGDVMRRHLITAAPEDSVEHITRLMLRYQIRRLPVVDNGKIVGIITGHDFLKLIAGSD